tara:strand:- start:726 stop:959 length:234 start_codon:yes stop_codon:yes gene_type:complete
MAQNCIYCKTPLQENSVIDVCGRCGVGVWGEKMFKAIVDGMEKARDTGDLNQGSVSSSQPENQGSVSNSQPETQRFT